MAQIMIRLDNEVYTELKKRADIQGRSYANLANYYLRKEFGWLPGQVNGTPTENTPTPKNITTRNLGPLDEFPYMKLGGTPPSTDVEELLKSHVDIKHVPDITSLEYSCCLNETKPCKHWQWDSASGEGYKNILSGRFREAV